MRKAIRIKDFVDTDLIIEIVPRGRTHWTGSRAQLIEEGLIPNGFEWPRNGEACKHWEAEQFTFTLRHVRPPGFNGRWRGEGDHWAVWRELTTEIGTGFAEAYIFEKENDLRWALWRRSPAGSAHWKAYCRADEDKTFQGALDRIVNGEPCADFSLPPVPAHSEPIRFTEEEAVEEFVRMHGQSSHKVRRLGVGSILGRTVMNEEAIAWHQRASDADRYRMIRIGMELYYAEKRDGDAGVTS